MNNDPAQEVLAKVVRTMALDRATPKEMLDLLTAVLNEGHTTPPVPPVPEGATDRPERMIKYYDAWTGLCIWEHYVEYCQKEDPSTPLPQGLQVMEDIRENAGIMELRSWVLEAIGPAIEEDWKALPDELREAGKDHDGTEWGLCFDFDYVPYWLDKNVDRLRRGYAAWSSMDPEKRVLG